MSRIGNSPIQIPSEVSVSLSKDNEIKVKGPLGVLFQDFKQVSVKIEDSFVFINRLNDSKRSKSSQGLYRALINNMILGVSKGFKKELYLVGVGYRASNQGQKLDLALGYSHNIILNICSEVKVETEALKGKPPVIKLASCDKQLLGQVVSKIRSYRKPDPYKGKGVLFDQEKNKKEGR